jgi:Na+-translocating ferredoxin:NAD+ oxidoreductase RnfG subunit
MDNFKLPLVLVVALGAQLAGAVFWGANILRDINDNTERTDALLEILVETEQSLQEVDEEIWTDVDNLAGIMTELIKLQARIAILEKTVEFTRRDGM